MCLVKWCGVVLISKFAKRRFRKMRNSGRHSLGSTAATSWFGNQARYSFAADGKTSGCPQLASGRRCTSLTFEPPKPCLSSLGNVSWDGLLQWMAASSRRDRGLCARPAGQMGNTQAKHVSPQVARLVWRTRRVGKTAEDVIDLNRVGREAEFTYPN